MDVILWFSLQALTLTAPTQPPLLAQEQFGVGGGTQRSVPMVGLT